MAKLPKKYTIEIDTIEAQKALWRIRDQFETVYAEDEVMELIKAFKNKHKYSCQDKIPYMPKPSKIIKGQI